MNRRNFLGSLVAAVPVLALGLRKQALDEVMPAPPAPELRTMDAGTSSFVVMSPESVRILWQKQVEVFEEAPDFWENLRLERIEETA
jgi:hypothetical protein